MIGNRLIIVGRGKIAQIHKHIFERQGVEVCAMVGSDGDLEAAIKGTRPNISSICSSNESHFMNLRTLMDNELPIFCEKPLFWDESCNKELLKKVLEQQVVHYHKSIMLNVSNITFLDAIPLWRKLRVKSFELIFHTNGKARRRNIAIDLLSHGLAFLIELKNVYGNIENLNEIITKNSYSCVFDYAGCHTIFRFKEDSEIPKALIFKINRKQYIRSQQGTPDTYKVFINQMKMHDPFEVFIKRFLRGDSNIDKACRITELMGDILL